MRGPIALGSAQQRSRPVNAARVVNLYPEAAPAGSRAKVVHYGTPGQKDWSTVGGDTIRAGLEAQGYAYILSGATLYRVDSDLMAVPCTGDLIPNTGAATLINNGVQIGLLVRPEMFVIVGTTVTKVTSAGFPTEGFSSLAYIDGYAVGTRDDESGEFYLSGLLDFSTFDALDFASAESSPDGLVAGLVDHREYWAFGGETIEVFSNTGASPFPLERVTTVERGCAAARSPGKLDNSLAWLGNDRMIYRANGYQPTRISTHTEEEILRVGTVSDAYSMTYFQGGHHFYALTLPSLGRTLVYDAATTLWHERQSGTSLTPAAWNPQCIFTAFGKTLVGLQAGKVAELDLDTYTDLDDAPIRSAITSLPIYPDGRRAIMSGLELECELGVGISTGQGSAPEVMMRYSDDGASSWSNERRTSIGLMGSRRDRAMFDRLGIFRQRTVEFAISDPVKKAIYGMNASIKALGR